MATAGSDADSQSKITTLIEKFKATFPEELKKHGKFNINDLKDIAKHFGMTSTMNKPELIEEIAKKLQNQESLSAMRAAAAAMPASSKFQKDESTMPRLMHVLSDFMPELIQSRRIARWSDLESCCGA